MEHSAYLALRENATVLEADGSGDKVLLLEDGTILKLFRRKRLISSALLFPYAQRFADNIDALKKRGIPCPDVIATYRIASISRDAVSCVCMSASIHCRPWNSPIGRPNCSRSFTQSTARSSAPAAMPIATVPAPTRWLL